jgi:hypothetical protein
MYGFETWSSTLREAKRLSVSENKVLKIRYGPRREEVAGGWRRLHNEELHNLYPSPNIIMVIKPKRMRWVGHIARMGKDKGKNVKLSLCLTKHHAMKTYWGAFLTSALDGGEWSASLPGLFTPRERVPGTHWIGGWVGPRAVLEAVVKRKIPSPRRESNPRKPIVQPVAQHYTD